MTTKHKSSNKISALPMSAQTEIQPVDVTDMTPTLDYYTRWWDEITDTKEVCEREALKRIQAMADLNYGELLVDLEKQDASIQHEFRKQKGITESVSRQLKQSYLTWCQAKGVLEGEALEKFQLVGYSTKALIQRLPTTRQADQIKALVSDKNPATNSSLRELVKDPEVKLEKASEDLGAAQKVGRKAAETWERVKDDPEIEVNSDAYQKADDANQVAKRSISTLKTQITKLEEQLATQVAATTKAKAAEARATKREKDLGAQHIKTIESMNDLQRRIRYGDYDTEGAYAFYLGSNAVFLTIGGLDHIMGEVRTYLHNSERYDEVTRGKIDQNLLILRDELNNFYKQD